MNIVSTIRLLLPLSLFIILIAACRQSAPTETPVATPAVDQTPSIVFVYADTVIARYKAFAEKQAALEKRGAEAESQLQSKARSLEREIQQFQQKAQQGVLTPNQITQEQERLGRKQEQLLQEREKSAMVIQQGLVELNDELQSTVKDVLSELQRERGYDFILSYGPGTGVLMVNDSLDITEEVLRRLNEKSAAADSRDTTRQ